MISVDVFLNLFKNIHHEYLLFYSTYTFFQLQTVDSLLLIICFSFVFIF